MAHESTHLVAIWRLLRFARGTGAPLPPIPGTELTATFQDDGRVAGSAGCNRYATTYKVTGSSLTVDPRIAATRMWCGDPEGTMEQEDAFLQAWDRVAAYDVREDRLEVVDAQGTPIFVFVRAETPGQTVE